jgi:hypothetical protein
MRSRPQQSPNIGTAIIRLTEQGTSLPGESWVPAQRPNAQESSSALLEQRGASSGATDLNPQIVELGGPPLILR